MVKIQPSYSSQFAYGFLTGLSHAHKNVYHLLWWQTLAQQAT
ncbi:hypothetical protein LCAZH_2608 [Lacticaseibacillus paracasei]|uniref:Uncharacterized protein n=1 Tax=Lacticaseibacillus paracasei subsp. paracasei TaxID=47714 RepID=A0AAP9KWJ8_LACPA|nr:hypothetical protein LCAZH_2608 [Lacticaseibacillus paracasei]AKU60773.1 hypothetical protein LPL9_2719 [Lacticaseibacillus paracasei]EEI69420.1 hypothetical protein HMPREF0530_0238 [Lacticaseibacillus paracasei subsp. paracasei ATCC 25302 = DSM 5622 = JCM 8130]QGV19367.1 Hypothetical protein LCAKO_2878 [Lacticaseibacillus paracasei subsp. paracasei]